MKKMKNLVILFALAFFSFSFNPIFATEKTYIVGVENNNDIIDITSVTEKVESEESRKQFAIEKGLPEDTSWEDINKVESEESRK